MILIFYKKHDSRLELIDNYQKQVILESYNGIVSRKYYFANRPNSPAINVKGEKNEIMIIFSYYNKEIYEYILEGDSVYKKENENLLKVIRNNYEICFQCVSK